MIRSEPHTITIKPVVSYPHEMEVGKRYLMSVDIATEGEWPYEREEYALHCLLDTDSSLTHEVIGEPVIVLHRFGGTYGPATFILTATAKEGESSIKLMLVNQAGLIVYSEQLPRIQIIPNRTFRQTLTNRSYLQTIDLAQREGWSILDLRNVGLTYFPREISYLTNLQSLDLSDNQLIEIPSEIGHLSNLTQLNLSNNQLTSVPPEIGQLSNLTSLSLGGNQLTAMPPEIGHLSNLTQLNLSNNQLTAVPPEIGQLLNLTQLNLSNNRLTTVPPEIGQLLNLTQLELWGNQLTAVPLEIGQLVNLTELWLSNNQLTQPCRPKLGSWSTSLSFT
jgi:Leucine-rich repeat (LRR) protein